MAIHRHTAGEINCKKTNKFLDDVLRGLQSTPKFLMSKYFYDAEGDSLFQQIMTSPEYYLTNCEFEIFSQQTKEIADTVLQELHNFDVIELGAGDATKSSWLLHYLVEQKVDITYYPVDISNNVIALLEQELPEKISGLNIKGLNGEYGEMIKKANQLSNKKKLVLFLGSNIGNMNPKEAVGFLQQLNQSLKPDDLLLIGVDLKKNPHQILAAYNDKAGITRQFNLNLLKRINRELGANFNVEDFSHYPTYNPVTGACRSYLISQKNQEVQIADESFQFTMYEPVYMELSHKYAVEEINQMATETGFQSIKHFFDCKHWFLDAVWKKT